MVFKLSKLINADNSGILQNKVIGILRKKKKLYQKTGGFLICIPFKLNRRLRRKKFKIIKYKNIFLRSKMYYNKLDLTQVKYKLNSSINLKKRVSPLGKYIKGPILFNIKRKKLLTSISFLI